MSDDPLQTIFEEGHVEVDQQPDVAAAQAEVRHSPLPRFERKSRGKEQKKRAKN
jgi:hypothetical protein